MSGEPEFSLDGSYLLSGLDSRERREIVQLAIRRNLAAGEFLFRKGDAASALYIMVSGHLSASVGSDSGRELIVREFHPGDVLGEIALFDREPRTAAVRATVDSAVVSVDGRDLRQFLESKPKFALRILELMALRLRQTTEALENQTFHTVESRLAKLLLALGDEQGEETRDGFRVSERLSQAWLAVSLGCAREVVNRRLASWEEQGLVFRRDGTVYLLDREAIEALAPRVI